MRQSYLILLEAQTLEDEKLRKSGLKVTTPRLAILNIFDEHQQKHLSAEEIYKRLLDQKQEIGLATVYRVLTQFEAAGLIRRHHFEGEHAVFELEDGVHHDHLVCVRCGHVIEFVDPVIEERQRVIALENGYKMTDHHLTIYGTCRVC